MTNYSFSRVRANENMNKYFERTKTITVFLKIKSKKFDEIKRRRNKKQLMDIKPIK